MKAYIKAIEYNLPEKVLTNAEIAETFPEWTVEKIEKKITKIVKEKEIKHCLFCDKEFEGEKNQKYCSVECYRADNRRQA